ncbi:MAG: hypothetical protein R2762_02165 [Bryobacteraceae bacterium]
MQSDVFHFVWRVPKDGFQWIETEPVDLPTERKDWFLSDGVPIGHSSLMRAFHPLSETGLFRTFAELEARQKTILEFANRYGRLGATIANSIRVAPHPAKPGASLLGSGESLSKWEHEIWEVRESVALLDGVQSAIQGADSVLSEQIKWEAERGTVQYTGPTRGRLPNDPKQREVRNCEIIAFSDSELHRHCQPGDLIVPARYYLQKRVNRKLIEHGVTARLLWDERWQGLGLYLVPSNLIGAIWLQIARAIDGNREYRRCLDCRKWFEVTPHVTRADRKFCSGSCKASAHRKKIGDAKIMHARGVSAKEIAAALETDVKTLKGWLK